MENYKIHQRYNNTTSEGIFNRFKVCRVKSKRLIRKTYNDYVRNTKAMLRREPKKIWNFIKSKKCDKSNIVTEFTFNEENSEMTDRLYRLLQIILVGVSGNGTARRDCCLAHPGNARHSVSYHTPLQLSMLKWRFTSSHQNSLLGLIVFIIIQ